MRRAQLFIAVILVLIILLGWLAFAKIKASSAPPTIKIGLIAPFEGHYRSTGYEVLIAVKLALRARNQGQGLNGYRVELVALNDFNEPDEAIRQAKALVADPDVVGVVGHFSSEATQAALPVYQNAGMAVVVPWSVDEEIFKDDTRGVVGVAATRAEMADQLQAVGRQLGFEQLYGLSGVNDVEVLSVGTQALQLNADAVTAGNILLALQEQGISVPVFAQADAGNRQLVQVAGTAADGVIFVSPGPNATDIQLGAPFTEAYQTQAGFPPPPRAVLAYDAANVLLDSIEQAMITNNSWFEERPDRARISEVIHNVQYQGLSGKIEFDGSGRRIDAPVWIYQISGTIYPGQVVVH